MLNILVVGSGGREHVITSYSIHYTKLYENFSLPQLDKGSRVLVVFEGAMSDPEVFVNGDKAGEWGYGYAYFDLDITDLVKVGRDNS